MAYAGYGTVLSVPARGGWNQSRRDAVGWRRCQIKLMIRKLACPLQTKAHCSINNEAASFPYLGNSEPRFREIISPRKMSNSEKMMRGPVSCDHKLIQTVLVHSLSIRHLPGTYYLPKSRRGLIVGLIVPTMIDKIRQ
jgi:hypothetical protein